jgi:hypothetical protein
MEANESGISQSAVLFRRIFADHGLKYEGLWRNTQYTLPAIAILKSGFFSGRELITSTGKRYIIANPADDSFDMLDYLLFDLVRTYLDYLSDDILDVFDRYFWWMAEIAQLGGVQKRRLEGLWQEWRKKILKRCDEGKINLVLWRHTIFKDENPPPPMAHELSKNFLRHIPQAKSKHVVEWTNRVLKALEIEPENENTLRLYVGKLKIAAAQHAGPISITK